MGRTSCGRMYIVTLGLGRASWTVGWMHKWMHHWRSSLEGWTAACLAGLVVDRCMPGCINSWTASYGGGLLLHSINWRIIISSFPVYFAKMLFESLYTEMCSLKWLLILTNVCDIFLTNKRLWFIPRYMKCTVICSNYFPELFFFTWRWDHLV